MFINEPRLIDDFIRQYADCIKNTIPVPDNIRIYIPMDLNKISILRRLSAILERYDEVNEDNELHFETDVEKIIDQVEIYDQIWYTRHMPKAGQHSAEAKELVKAIVERLEEVEDGCAEKQPYELIERLMEEYLKD